MIGVGTRALRLGFIGLLAGYLPANKKIKPSKARKAKLNALEDA